MRIALMNTVPSGSIHRTIPRSASLSLLAMPIPAAMPTTSAMSTLVVSDTR